MCIYIYIYTYITPGGVQNICVDFVCTFKNEKPGLSPSGFQTTVARSASLSVCIKTCIYIYI